MNADANLNTLLSLMQQMGAMAHTLNSNSTLSQTHNFSTEHEQSSFRTRNTSTEHISSSNKSGKPKKPNSEYQSIFNFIPNPITKPLWANGKKPIKKIILFNLAELGKQIQKESQYTTEMLQKQVDQCCKDIAIHMRTISNEQRQLFILEDEVFIKEAVVKTFDKKLSYVLRRNKLKKNTSSTHGRYQRCFSFDYDSDCTNVEVAPLERLSSSLQSFQPHAASPLFPTSTQESSSTSASSNNSTNSNIIQRTIFM